MLSEFETELKYSNLFK